MTTSSGLTVLRTVGSGRATKQFIWDEHLRHWRKVSYQAGAWFVATEVAIADLVGLVEVLDRVRCDPRAFVVRGALVPEVAAAIAENPAHRIRRRKHAKDGIEPSLAETERRWIMIDVDDWPLRAIDDLVTEPDDAIDNAIRELLPEPFHDAECWWQLSSSAGFVPGTLKVHLFFWLSEPASNRLIKDVLAQHAPGVDRAPYSAAHSHFIADPIIEGGHDPLPRRTGWRRGIDPVVTLPALRPPAQQQPHGVRVPGSSGNLEDALATLGHGEGGQGFHAPLRAATLIYARQCHRGRPRDDDEIKATLRAAIRAAPCRPGGNVEAPYCQNHYLRSLIDGAFALLAGDREIQTMRPHHQAAVHTLEQARAQLAEHVSGFFTRALNHGAGKPIEVDAEASCQLLAGRLPPEHQALVVGVGTGKSTAARAALPEFIEAARAAGQPHRVLWPIPTHRLGTEALALMQQLGLRAAVWRGREASVPGSGDPEN